MKEREPGRLTIKLLISCSFVSACSYRRHGEGGISLCAADYWCPCNIEAELLTSGPRTPNGNRQAGDVSGVPAAGHRAWVSWALSPAFGVRHTELTCWVLLFGVVFILYKFLADALWEQLLCYGYSAEDFWFLTRVCKYMEWKKLAGSSQEVGFCSWCLWMLHGLMQSLDERGFQNCSRLQVWLFLKKSILVLNSQMEEPLM